MDRRAIREFTHKAGDHLKVSHENYKQWVFRYTFLELEKDLGIYGDVSSKSVFEPEKMMSAEIVARGAGLLAGRQEIEYFLRDADSKFRPRIAGGFDLEFLLEDGAKFIPGDRILKLSGSALDVLAVERVVLNLLSRMSGVASYTAKLLDLIKDFDVMLAPTRKTLWGLLDKRAVLLGGAGTHRINLSDSIIIKDTHLDQIDRNFDLLFEKLATGVCDVRFVEVEVENKEEALTVARKFGEAVDNKSLMVVGVIMLDNMSADEVEEAVGALKEAGLYDSALIEASGGINKDNLLEYAKTGVDIISMGALTGGVKGADFSMKVL